MSNKKILKGLFLSLGATVGAGIGAYKSIADKIFDTVFVSSSDKTLIYNNVFSNFDNKFIEEESIKNVDWINSANRKKVAINSIDNLRLDGELILNNNSDKLIIFVHGYLSNLDDMYMYAKRFDELGYDCLLINQRCHGDSEGKYITFGLKESIDLVSWINFINTNYPNKNIILYGVSMGASTCLMSLINKLPNNVKAVISDSGYSDFSKILSSGIKKVVRLPLWQLMYQEVCRLLKAKTNISIHELDVSKYLVNNEIPVLFIHSEDDKTIPVEMSKNNYQANKGFKKLYLVKNCDHINCIKDKDYVSTINQFINFVLKK